MHTLNLEQLKAATLAGGVIDVTLRGDGAAFVVSIQTRSGEAMMVTTRKQPRRFADPRKALQLLRGIGLHECRINATDWDPQAHALEKVARPDRSVALKAALKSAGKNLDNHMRSMHGRRSMRNGITNAGATLLLSLLIAM